MRAPALIDAEPAAALTLQQALRLAAARLAQAGVESARLDAEVLLCHVLGLERDGLFVRLRKRLRPSEQKQFEALLECRAARQPLAYLTGVKEFWSLDFIVTPAVLIPRPETELLVELVLDHTRESCARAPVRILDIGTGSGAISVALAKHLPNAEVWALDVSAAALEVAAVNARKHKVEKRVRFVESDLFPALEPEARFDVIVANPPYIRSAELTALAPEISWEPRLALDGGSGGGDFYPKIISAAPDHLCTGGRIFLETAADWAEGVAGLFARNGHYLPAAVHRDYAGRDRVVAATKGRGRG